MKQVKVKEIAFCQSGDKGDISNVFVIPYRDSDYELLLDNLTEDKVSDIYAELVDGDVHRYELNGIKAINFVMCESLGGGVSSSINIDIHGKNRGSLLLDAELQLPNEYVPPPTIDGQKKWSRRPENESR